MLKRFLIALCCLCPPEIMPGAQAAPDTPNRVVSMNLCTDQLAMLLAAPGQLHSVSYLALQEDASVMAEAAKRYVVNHGHAEEIFLMKPDLVIAGTYTTRATVALLRRLGFRLEEFEPASSFAAIHDNLRRMGRLLGQEARAEALLAEFETRLKRYAGKPEKRPVAALYYANSYTSGRGTLADEALGKAGLDNLGKRLGYRGTAKLPLEVLIMNAPDFVIGGGRYGKSGIHAYDNLTHPALRAIQAGNSAAGVPDKYWICGTPFTAEAVRILADIAAGAAK